MDLLTRKWLEPYRWESVLSYFAHLHHRSVETGGLSSAYEQARAFWGDAAAKQLTLRQALETCRQCRALNPFGNDDCETFAAIATTIIEPLTVTLSPTLAATVAAMVKDFVCGETDENELAQALRLLEEKCPRNEFERQL